MWRNIASNALTLFVVVLIAVGGLIAWGKAQYTAEGPLEQAICLRVDAGSNMRRVANELAEDGAVSSPSIFRMGAEYSDKAGLLKAGAFLVPEGASMAEIVEIVMVVGHYTMLSMLANATGVPLEARLPGWPGSGPPPPRL